MKKLLLFVVTLFITLSVQTLAVNYGCGEDIPPYVCGADSTRNTDGSYKTSAPAITYYGGMAIDLKTRRFSSSWNYQDGESAKQSALKNCGTNMCVGTWASYAYMAIAISEDEKNWGYGAGDTNAEAWKDAIDMCQKSNKVCEVAIVGNPRSEAVYAYWGALAYNPRTGDVGVVKQGLRGKSTSQDAFNKAKCMNTECKYLLFQQQYGALVKTPGGIVYGYTSNKSLKDVEKQAIKYCKKESKEKTCEIIVSSSK